MEHGDYTVAWICALPTELAAALAILDESHNPLLQDAYDYNNYTLGRIGVHNVVIACLPSGVTGITSAAIVASHIRFTFPSIRFGLMVGIGGGAPSAKNDIRLGDVVISKPEGTSGGVIQYDFGKTVQEARFVLTGSLNRPPTVLLNAVNTLQAKHLIEEPKLIRHLSEMLMRYPRLQSAVAYPGLQHDQLFKAEYDHRPGEDTCTKCDPLQTVCRSIRSDSVPGVHYGLIASGNQVMRDGVTRERLQQELDVLCFEMEAAGLMDDFPCLVIRGICDYADSHKNKRWQPYAAAVAAAYAKELLCVLPANQVVHTRTFGETGALGCEYIRLDEHETNLERDVQACEIRRSVAVDTHLMHTLHQLGGPVSRIENRVSDLLERVDLDEQLKILEWVSSVPFRKHHITIREERASDTCEWLVRHEKFYEWKETSSSAILWLQGSPGAGKTFLTSKVIDHIEDTLKTSSSPDGFAFFYCNRNEDLRREPVTVLRSYVRQLSTTVKSPMDMQKKLQALYRESRLQGSDLTFGTCKQLLLESLNLYPKTTLVLDALDECKRESRDQLIKLMESVLSQSKKAIKVFISSRPDSDIRRRLLSWPNIDIQATDNQTDIEKYVGEEIVRHPYWRKGSRSLQKDIVNTLLERSQGMFQWAYLQIKQLLELKTEAALRSRLGRLPRSLKEAYDEIYEKIANQNEHDRIFAERAFMWVMSAVDPLSSRELLFAIRLDFSKDAANTAEKINEDLLLDLCHNLLVIDPQQKVWRFSHLSVTEYLEEHRWTMQQAHLYVAKVCLHHLIDFHEDFYSDTDLNSSCAEPQQEDDQSEISDTDSNSSGAECQQDEDGLELSLSSKAFHHYMHVYWVTHVQTQEMPGPDPTLSDLLKTFLGSPNASSLQYQIWCDNADYDAIPFSLDRDDLSSHNVAIFAMCRFAFYNLVLDWWESEELDLSLVNNAGKDLLTLAVEASCRPICENLVKRGIQVNCELRNCYGNALVTAVYKGNFEIVKFLVQGAGADVNMMLQRGVYGSALAATAYRGDIEIVKFLIQGAGADVNMMLQGGVWGSALAATAHKGDIDIVKFLIQEAEADVNMLLQCGRYGSALAAATWMSHIEIVKFLIQEAEADVNMLLQCGCYGSALAAAAAAEYQEENIERNIEVVKFLIQEAEADVNMLLPCGSHGSALAAAAYQGNIEVVKFLIQEAGADVNMLLQCGEYGTALAAAAYRGNFDCVETLLEAGANVNIKVKIGRFENALKAARAPFVVETQLYWWPTRKAEAIKEGKERKERITALLERWGATT